MTVPHFDYELFSKQLRGRLTLMHRMVTVFLEEMPSRFIALHQAIIGGDHAHIAHAAHSIKGAAANMAALELFACAKQIEDDCERLDSVPLLQLYQSVEESYHALITDPRFIYIETYSMSCPE